MPPESTGLKVHQPAEDNPRTVPLVFTGKAGEYFGIWIVNLLLTIITIGIYTPWAKVRKRRYFFGNTLLDDAPFDYRADPIVLLRGWAIAALLFLIYTLGARIHPLIAPVATMIFFIGMPWLVVRSLMFNARNTAYRNIRFSFRPEYREAYTIFLGLSFLTPLTLGLIVPYAIYRQKKFIVENLSFGKTGFSFAAEPKSFYWLTLKTAGLFIAIFTLWLPLQLLFAGQLKGLAGFVNHPGNKAALFAGAGLFMFLSATGYLAVTAYWKTAITNLIWNNSRLGSNRFNCKLKAMEMAWIYLGNALAIIVSLGLLAPWAAIRLARYRLERLSLDTRENMGNFLANPQEEIGAAGEEISEVFGVDFSL